MAVDSNIALERARVAYERSRAKRAALLVLPMAALAWLGCLLGAAPSTAVCVGAALVVGSWFFLWRGQSLGSAVPWGVLAGLIPLTLAFGARSLGHVCTGSQCVSLCVPACTLGGLAAGVLIARAGRRVPRSTAGSLGYFAAAGSLAALEGTLGCSCVGYGGVLGLLLGLAMSLGPAVLLRAAPTAR